MDARHDRPLIRDAPSSTAPSAALPRRRARRRRPHRGDRRRGAAADASADAHHRRRRPGARARASSTCTPTPTWQILLDPEHLAKISQGVTTEVLGQDGLSYAPVDDAALAMLRRKIAGWNDRPGPDFDFYWRSVGDYLDRLDQGIAGNAAYLVPQGMLRALVVGWDDRAGHRGRDRGRCRQIVRTEMARGRGRHVQRADLHPGHVRRQRGAAALCAVGGRSGRLLRPAPPLLRRGCARRVRGDARPGRAAPAARCTSPTPP